MRRLFQLRDDVTTPGRWNLGEVRTAAGVEPLLDAGTPFSGGTEELQAALTKNGRVLDFSLTSFATPIASSAIASAVEAIAGPDVQCIPVKVGGQSGMKALNALRVISCLDESRSEFIKWTMHDHRADLAGQYRQVTKLFLDPKAVPHDAHFFRIQGWLVALIVSEDMKNAMERVGCLGAKFVPV
jgi:hypothetical protein